MKTITGKAVGWHDCRTSQPMESQRVIAIYKGVYHHRIVTFWIDDGGNAHYGFPTEPDGKGSQPATHWHPLPELPNKRPTTNKKEKK